MAPPIRLWVIEQVGRHPDPGAVGLLAEVLDDPDIQIVRAAVVALAGRPEPSARELLMPMRAHHDPQISRLVGEMLAGTSSRPRGQDDPETSRSAIR